MHLGVGGGVDVEVEAGVRALDPGVPGAESDAELLGDQQQLAHPAQRAGSEQATALARPPLRSSPALATPVNSQPTGSGQGIQTGT